MIKNSIIVPVFNRVDLTTTFIKSVGEYLSPTDELIIVDNNSTDNTELVVNIYSRTHPRHNIVYVKNPENYGFGRANNIGALKARGENLLFISNDVVVSGNFIFTSAEYLDKHPNDAIGARVIAWETGWNNIWVEVALIPYIEGWYMGMKRRSFDIVGGFDNDIFCDYEDVDLSHRLHLAGVGLAQINLPIFHPYSGSSFSQLNEERIKITYRSIEHFGRKWGYTRK